jgi:hypothetical protein
MNKGIFTSVKQFTFIKLAEHEKKQNPTTCATIFQVIHRQTLKEFIMKSIVFNEFSEKYV